MANLGLNGSHEDMILDYLKSAKYKRNQCLKGIETAFSDLVESRLMEETFTSEEVKEILDGLCGVLKADIASDLIHSSHTSALLLRQLFQQAEKWHLKLQMDLSELESKELLEQIAHFEQCELKGSTSFHKHQILEPINTSGGDKLLQMEIQRLNEEKSKLQTRILSLEEKVTSALDAKDCFQVDMLNQQSAMGRQVDSDLSQHLEQIALLQQELSEVKSIRNTERLVENTDIITRELEDASHKLLHVTSELEETKKDLERKFNDTPQYVNMRKMLTSKNDTIKDLRAQIKKLELTK